MDVERYIKARSFIVFLRALSDSAESESIFRAAALTKNLPGGARLGADKTDDAEAFGADL